MGFTGILGGSFIGLTTKLGSNLLQKLPYMRHPWEHVLFIGLGAYAGNKFEEKYENDMKEVEELRLYLERRPAIRKEE